MECVVPRVLCVAIALLGSVPARAQLTITEFPVPTANSRPYTITPGPDGNLWFTESNGNKIARITPAGVITEFPVPTPGSAPYGIAAGPDGNLWFTERFGDQIGRFSPATGQFAEFPVPTGNSQPWDITLAADGNLWFTEDDAHQIGRVTPQGVVTEFVPPSCCFPIGIGAGADGNAWFALEIGDQIGRVEPSGAITMFQIASVQVLPWDITPGPDGAVWFSELAGRALGRISAQGQIVEHPIPGPFSGVAGVATGPDGNLWFTENDTDRVGAMDTSGAIQHSLSTSAGARPLSICAGPDGNLWFTEADGNRIGRVNLAQPGEAHVLSLDAGFAPRLRVASLGASVQWTFLGPNVHSVVDGSGLALFDSGPQRIVSYFVLPFHAAGTFVYRDGAGSAPRAAISVPVDLPPIGFVGAPFPVTWAQPPAPGGLVFDVEVRTPGSGAFVPWMSGTALSANYTAVTAGLHQFRARLRDPLGGKATLYSMPADILVQ